MENHASMMTMVEVFKTDVPDQLAGRILEKLCALLPEARITFDLEDCDKILRIEANKVPVPSVLQWLENMEVKGEVLPD